MRKICLLLLSAALVLSGCGGTAPAETEPSIPETTQAAEAIRFPDGDPETAACLGSYTAQEATDTVIALVEETELTNRELQAWYWAEVAQYRLSGGQGLDDSLPLDQQSCPIDDSVATWQQYFLKQALNTWHTAQALLLQGERDGVPLEEPTYNPTKGNYAKYMDGMPATKVLYGYDKQFHPNAMHQAYLDALPEALADQAESLGYGSAGDMARQAFASEEEDLLAFVREYNLAYMYFTSLCYLLEAEELPQTDSGEGVATFRHILCTGDMALGRAWDLWEEWDHDWKSTESLFASMAFEHSQDAGSAVNGGLYCRASREQLPPALADWCLDPQRQPGDTTVLETEQGAHVVYFLEAQTNDQVLAEQEQLREKAQALLDTAREQYPLSVSYGDILLAEAEGNLGKDALLYPDIAHERFPEVPLYLQQDYPGVMYGGFRLQTNGCGITSFAMLASYMADEALTPPYMCGEYGIYSSDSGTDSGIFRREGGLMDCFQIYSTYDWQEAREYVEQGYPCIVLQHKGYWTRGGHYLVLEKMDEDGLVQVRDSNIYNYSRIREGHIIDRFPWDVIHRNSAGYWVFAKKDVTTPACTRCGTGDAGKVCSDYLCEKCREATLRREAYLAAI